jgi:GT2 family glycosyltransferase
LLLNSDTLLEKGALQTLADYLENHPRAAIVGPRLLNQDGTLQVSCYPFPTPLNTLFVNSSLGRLIGHIPVMRTFFYPAWRHNQARAVPWVVGAALAIRREAFEAVGGFDEAFFMYYEEVDLCYRMKALGWQTHFTPDAAIVHEGGASTAQYRTDMQVKFFASAIRFCQRHYSGMRLTALTTILKGIILARWISDTLRLHVTRDTKKCIRIAEDVTAWKRVLQGDWQR